MWGISIHSFGIILLTNWKNDYIHKVSFSVFPLTSYALYIFLIFGGLYTFQHKLKPKLTYALALLLCLSSFGLNYSFNQRRDFEFAQRFSQVIFSLIEKNAILLVQSDEETAVLGEKHYIEKVRPDIDIYNSSGQLFPNRLFDPIFSSTKSRSQKLNTFLQQTERPIYYFPQIFKHPWGRTSYGILEAIDKNQQSLNLQLSPVITGFYNYLISNSFEDRWSINFKAYLLYSLTKHFTLMRNNMGASPQRKSLEKLIIKGRTHFMAFLGELEINKETKFKKDLIKEAQALLDSPQTDRLVTKGLITQKSKNHLLKLLEYLKN